MSGRITEGFRKIVDLRWSEFIALEGSPDATNFDSIVSALVRACMKGNLRAIQVALDRLDGKIATEIEVEYPKFYTLYPRATKAADDASIIDELVSQIPAAVEGSMKKRLSVMSGPADQEELDAESEELPTGSLRAVLERMLNSPKDVVGSILQTAEAVDKGNLDYGNPMVKSVIVAGLMKLVHDGRVSAVFEVMDQIDGKVADVVKLLGADVYFKRYDLIAPAGAVKNENGVYQIANDNTTNTWAARLAAGAKR